MRNGKVVVGFACGVAVSVAVYAQQRSGSLTAQDYAEIQQIYAQYHWAADARDGVKWANLYTPDGVQIRGDVRTVGRENLKNNPPKNLGPWSPASAIHFATNIRIEPSPDGARGGAYQITMTPPQGGKPGEVVGFTTYDDILVKTSEGWKIKQRTLHQNLPPSMIVPPPK